MGLKVENFYVVNLPFLNSSFFRNGQIITDASKRATSDNSVKGYKKLLKENPENAKRTLDLIIKNTYRTLMTRGMKGCYVYFLDKETEAYFKENLGQ
jgi:uncharacterized protein